MKKARKLEAVVITPTIELSSKPESGKAKQKAQATQPLSALAARRAAIESGSYNEPEEVEPDSESEAEPETPQEVTSITDEEEEEDQVSGDDIEEVEEEGEEVDPLSRGITPTNTDPSSLVEEQRPKKKKVKK
jgi:hypothetical protein